MPVYTILGATGKTGGAILTQLLASSEKDTTNINLYVRSKRKLFAQRPDLSSNKSVNIVEGAVTSISLMKSCLSPNVDAVFVTLGVNENMPGVRVNQDACQALVAALCQIRFADPKAKMPKIVLLSSASLNPVMEGPAAMHWVLMRALSHPYGDLILAERFLRMQEDWLDVTFITPGALVEDVPKGHELTTEKAATWLSYADLAAGMVQVAREGGHSWVKVGVMPKGEAKMEMKALAQIVRGLVWYFAPFVGQAMSYVGIF